MEGGARANSQWLVGLESTSAPMVSTGSDVMLELGAESFRTAVRNDPIVTWERRIIWLII